MANGLEQDPRITQRMMEQMRMSGMFQPQPMPTPPQQMPQLNPLESYQPQTGAADRFGEMVGNYPQQGDNSIMQKIALSMMALSDPRLAAQLGNQPTREQQDWQAQIGPAQSAAQMENQSNQGMQLYLDRLRRGDQADVRLGQAGRGMDIRETVEEGRGTRAQKTLDARVEASALDTERDIASAALAESGRVGRADTAEEGRVDRQERGIGAGITAADVASTRRKDAAELSAEAAMERRLVPSTTAGETPAAKSKARLNRADEVLARNPEYDKFITRRGTTLTIKPWKDPWFTGPTAGLTKEEYDAVVNEIYGSEEDGLPQVGDTKTFPNGNVGVWDGEYWIPE